MKIIKKIKIKINGKLSLIQHKTTLYNYLKKLKVPLKKVAIEFEWVMKRQIKGDVIIFDDYDPYNFKGIYDFVHYLEKQKKLLNHVNIFLKVIGGSRHILEYIILLTKISKAACYLKMRPLWLVYSLKVKLA